MPKRQTPAVFYDGECPLCTREIAFYKRSRGAEDVEWIDVSCTPESEVAPGLTRDQALTRFYVLDADGTLVSGGKAFSALWSALPSFRFLGRLFQVRPLAWILDRAYDLFLTHRPRLQAALKMFKP